MTLQAQTDHHLAALLKDGFCIVEQAIDPALVEALSSDLKEPFEATLPSIGAFYGSGTRRFGSLLRRSANAAAFVQHALILSVVERVLGPHCDRFQLNLTQAIEIAPGSPMQPPHRDQDMWGGPKGELEYLVNVMWPFTPYTRENGATRLWRSSHKRQQEIVLPEEEAVHAEMQPGAALLFLGSTLHGGSPNLSRAARRGMVVSYCLGWLKPYENQWLAYPPAVAAQFTPELASLVGYSLHRPNLGNYEARCPSVLLQEKPPAKFGACDELLPEQEALIQAYLAGELQVAA